MNITLQSLSAFPQLLEAQFRAIPERFWRWIPDSWDGVPSESLNALEQICHVRDIEIDGYQSRFRRLLQEDHPLLASIDTYLLVTQRDYAHADPDAVFAEIHTARRHTVELLTALTPAQWARTGSFEGYGDVTILSLAHFLCSHDQQHLAGLQWLRGKMASSYRQA